MTIDEMKKEYFDKYIKTILSEKDKDIWEDSFDDMIDSIQDAINYEISEDNDTEEKRDENGKTGLRV